MNEQKKHLGQHWLDDEDSLVAMVEAGDISPEDTVLEVGPGPGALTKLLVKQAKEVHAVEFDDDLARQLRGRVTADNMTIYNEDILDFDFGTLPNGYKVVANIPYYLTSALLRKLLEADNKPSRITLLIQKEVAQRIAAKPGKMSILAISAQFYAKTELHALVPAEYFTPPPKVDSQIISLKLYEAPLFHADTQKFFRIVRAGFGEKRKKLANSLSGGLQISKQEAEQLVADAGLGENARAQELSLEDWYTMYSKIEG